MRASLSLLALAATCATVSGQMTMRFRFGSGSPIEVFTGGQPTQLFHSHGFDESGLSNLVNEFFGGNGFFGQSHPGILGMTVRPLQGVIANMVNDAKALLHRIAAPQSTLQMLEDNCACHCKADAQKFCSDIDKTGKASSDMVNLMQCFHRHFDQLSGMCSSSLDRYDVAHICGDEVKKHCDHIFPGNGRLHACLLSIEKSDVGEKCGLYLNKDKASADPSFLEKVSAAKIEAGENGDDDDDSDDVFPMEELEEKVEKAKKASKEMMVWVLAGIGGAFAVLLLAMVVGKSKSRPVTRPIGYVPMLT
jgi:hypothetical protein